MHVPINVKSPNNISKWQMGFNSAFKGLNWPSACTYKRVNVVTTVDITLYDLDYDSV
jgi:hypothetical protein